MMEAMKDSGIRWIGAIPESWNTKRIKYVANLKGRIGWQGLTSEEYQVKEHSLSRASTSLMAASIGKIVSMCL